MRVIRDEIKLCTDCMIIAVNADYSGLQYYLDGDKLDAKIDQINAGLDKLGPNLVMSFDPDFQYDFIIELANDARRELGLPERTNGIDEFDTWNACECCGTRLHGARYDFAILGE